MSTSAVSAPRLARVDVQGFIVASSSDECTILAQCTAQAGKASLILKDILSMVVALACKRRRCVGYVPSAASCCASRRVSRRQPLKAEIIRRCSAVTQVEGAETGWLRSEQESKDGDGSWVKRFSRARTRRRFLSYCRLPSEEGNTSSKPKLATVKARLKNLGWLAFFVIVAAGSLYHGIDGLVSESVKILPRDGRVYHIYWSEEPIWCTYAVIVWFVLSAFGMVGLYLIGLNWYYARNARLRQRSTPK